jgi:hypothetical protein
VTPAEHVLAFLEHRVCGAVPVVFRKPGCCRHPNLFYVQIYHPKHVTPVEKEKSNAGYPHSRVTSDA